MKSMIIFLATMLVTMPGIDAAFAQDPVEVSPEHYRVVFENERVRVLEVRYRPGERSEFHQHPDNLVIALSDAVATGISEDGTTGDLVFEFGDVVWRDAQQHYGSNASDEEFHLIFVEFKDAE